MLVKDVWIRNGDWWRWALNWRRQLFVLEEEQLVELFALLDSRCKGVTKIHGGGNITHGKFSGEVYLLLA